MAAAPEALRAPLPALARSGSFDPARRRKAQRSGRQRGCFVYIPAEMLQAAGYDPAGPVPHYRVWAGRRGGLTLRLYREA